MFAAGPGTITAVVHLMNAEKRLWRIVDHQTRQSNLAIGNVVVDALGEQIFTGLIYFHSLDCSTSRQLGDDMVALGICIRIRGVRDLKCESS